MSMTEEEYIDTVTTLLRVSFGDVHFENKSYNKLVHWYRSNALGAVYHLVNSSGEYTEEDVASRLDKAHKIWAKR